MHIIDATLALLIVSLQINIRAAVRLFGLLILYLLALESPVENCMTQPRRLAGCLYFTARSPTNIGALEVLHVRSRCCRAANVARLEMDHTGPREMPLKRSDFRALLSVIAFEYMLVGVASPEAL